MNVKLLYDPQCPNIEAAQAIVANVFDEMKLEHSWIESDLHDLTTTAQAHGFGSPTILVNDRDVMGLENQSEAGCCRVYSTSAGFSGVPPKQVIVSAITEAINTND